MQFYRWTMHQQQYPRSRLSISSSGLVASNGLCYQELVHGLRQELW
jgi:hypothetical protein